MNFVVLSLGSNTSYELHGETISPHVILKKAVESLSIVLNDITVSSLYITKPMYYEDQEWFHNIVVQGNYYGSAENLLEKTQGIETAFGRNRAKEIKNGPRSLDIDILLFSNKEVCNKTLQIPHPKMTERAFVLVPMLEIFPNCADSTKRDYYMHCLQKIDSSEVIKKSSL